MRSYLNIKTEEWRLKLQQQQQLDQLAAVQQQEHQQQQLQQQDVTEPAHQLLDLRIKQPPTADPRALGSAGGEHKPLFELGQPISCAPPPPPLIKIEPASPPKQAGHFSRSHRLSRLQANNQQLVAKPLESLSPSDVRKLLVKVLNDDETLPISDRRQITGELCRTPKDFYDKVWSLLSCTNVGIVIGGKVLRSIPILTNMTQDDLNFALKVESMLSGIDCPKLRQINVELLMALHVILERNPEIRFETDPLDLNKIINLSLDKFRGDFNRDDYGLQEYYTQSVQTTMLYTVRTVFDCLLPVKCKGKAECRLS